ncbi:class I SAM-dependent methyltransferase [Streptomyces zagrosensis]|uniref:S-adenosyl-L-methionine-dependent methyltransferase n=1 Tax=Streptomyces zagrosensis TaxID=1042984 RepID=A0A7W9V205_9ACTN|nr:class I SAM-dependent methyltransferase [Streptomyces zagrosensis]MBB5939843.1 methyltransferase (TIGR00027 family) [Streptomyces zagrosensis]
MQVGQPSLTARAAAALRAAHQELDGGRVFADPLALRILGPYADDPLCAIAFEPEREAVRVAVASRSRYAEEAAAVAVAERKVQQVVVLGAGLDTFGYRNPHGAAGVRVFEVDYPATHDWKQRRLVEAGIAVPDSLTFAPVDFEQSSLAEGLTAAGFDSERPGFFICLGVIPYLTPDAISSTLGFVASLPAGSEIVFDYGEPPSSLAPEHRAAHEQRAEWAAKYGEPFRSLFSPGELADLLRGFGFSSLDDVLYSELAYRYEQDMADQIEGVGAHVVRAVV